jgi:hypothetical protein
VHELAPPAAHLPQAVVGVAPVAFQVVQQRLLHVPGGVRRLEAGRAGDVQAVEYLAPHVELELPGGGVAHPDGGGVLVAGQPLELVLGKPARAVEPVHDLQVGRVAGDRADQPLPPGPGLGEEPGAEQRLQGERGVPQPAVAVVPVAGTAELLGQRGGRRGDDAPGRGVGQCLQGDQGAAHRLGFPPVVAAPGHPVGPELLAVLDRLYRVDGPRPLGVRQRVGQHEGHRLALGDVELGGGGQVPADQLHGGAQPHRVGPGHRHVLATDLPHPRHDVAVVEPQPQLHPHPHPARHAGDQPDDVGGLTTRGHAVGDPDRALGRVPLAVQHEGLGPVRAPGAGAAGGWSEQPPARGLVPQQRGEAGGGVEPGQAQPVDRPVPAHQGRGVQVAEQPVVLDAAGHVPQSPSCRTTLTSSSWCSSARS